MSLINDMLNDLDKRRSQQLQENLSVEWVSGQKISERHTYFMPLLAFITLMLFLAIAFGIWQYQKNTDLTAVSKLNALNQPSDVSLDNQSLSRSSTVIEPTVSDVDTSLTDKEEPADDITEEMIADQKTVYPDNQQIIKKKGASQPLSKKAMQTISQVDNHTIKENVAVAVSSMSPIEEKQEIRTLSFAQQDIATAKKANQLLRAGNITQAENHLQDLLVKQPLASQSGELLVSIWLSQQRYDEAEKLLSTLRSNNSRNPRLIFFEARLSFLRGDVKSTVDLLMREKPSIALHNDYYELLGLAARQNQQYQLSAKVYQGLLEYNNQRSDWWIGLGMSLDMQGLSGLARSAYQQGINLRDIKPTLRNYALQRLSVL